MSDLNRLSSFEWDIFVEELYDEEKKKVHKELNNLAEELEYHETCTINNTGKYHERVHEQNSIRKEYGCNLPASVTMENELDDVFSEIDDIVIPGYEPEELPKFSTGGYIIPDGAFEKKKENRGRKKNNPFSSAAENYRFIQNYTETPQSKAEEEADRRIEEERIKSKRGRGNPRRKITFKIPRAPLEKPISLISVPAPIPIERPAYHPDLIVRRGRQVGSTNKPKVAGNEREEKEKAKRMGRKVGSINIGPTALTKEHVVIVDKDIVMRKNPTMFELYLFQYSRKNKDFSMLKWTHNAEKEFKKIMESLKESINDYMNKWIEINSSAISCLREMILGKKYDEVLQKIIDGTDNVLPVDEIVLEKNGISRHKYYTYASFLSFFSDHKSIDSYITTILEDESTSETIFATANEPELPDKIKNYVGTKERYYAEFTSKYPNMTYHPEEEGQPIRNLVTSVNGIPIVGEFNPEIKKFKFTMETYESLLNIPIHLIECPKKCIEKDKKKEEIKEEVKVIINRKSDPKHPNFTNRIGTSQSALSILNSQLDFTTGKVLPETVVSAATVKSNSRFIPHHDNMISSATRSSKRNINVVSKPIINSNINTTFNPIVNSNVKVIPNLTVNPNINAVSRIKITPDVDVAPRINVIPKPTVILKPTITPKLNVPILSVTPRVNVIPKLNVVPILPVVSKLNVIPKLPVIPTLPLIPKLTTIPKLPVISKPNVIPTLPMIPKLPVILKPNIIPTLPVIPKLPVISKPDVIPTLSVIPKIIPRVNVIPTIPIIFRPNTNNNTVPMIKPIVLEKESIPSYVDSYKECHELSDDVSDSETNNSHDSLSIANLSLNISKSSDSSDEFPCDISESNTTSDDSTDINLMLSPIESPSYSKKDECDSDSMSDINDEIHDDLSENNGGENIEVPEPEPESGDKTDSEISEFGSGSGSAVDTNDNINKCEPVIKTNDDIDVSTSRSNNDISEHEPIIEINNVVESPSVDSIIDQTIDLIDFDSEVIEPPVCQIIARKAAKLSSRQKAKQTVEQTINLVKHEEHELVDKSGENPKEMKSKPMIQSIDTPEYLENILAKICEVKKSLAGQTVNVIKHDDHKLINMSRVNSMPRGRFIDASEHMENILAKIHEIKKSSAEKKVEKIMVNHEIGESQYTKEDLINSNSVNGANNMISFNNVNMINDTNKVTEIIEVGDMISFDDICE